MVLEVGSEDERDAVLRVRGFDLKVRAAGRDGRDARMVRAGLEAALRFADEDIRADFMPSFKIRALLEPEQLRRIAREATGEPVAEEVGPVVDIPQQIADDIAAATKSAEFMQLVNGEGGKLDG